MQSLGQGGCLHTSKSRIKNSLRHFHARYTVQRGHTLHSLADVYATASTSSHVDVDFESRDTHFTKKQYHLPDALHAVEHIGYTVFKKGFIQK